MSGSAGRNECPADSSRIETEAVCRAAVAATGKTLGSPFVDSNPDFPRGCYLMTNDAFFNQHVPGGSDSGSRLLCAVVSAVVTAPESVPPPARLMENLNRSTPTLSIAAHGQWGPSFPLRSRSALPRAAAIGSAFTESGTSQDIT